MFASLIANMVTSMVIIIAGAIICYFLYKKHIAATAVDRISVGFKTGLRAAHYSTVSFLLLFFTSCPTFIIQLYFLSASNHCHHLNFRTERHLERWSICWVQKVNHGTSHSCLRYVVPKWSFKKVPGKIPIAFYVKRLRRWR